MKTVHDRAASSPRMIIHMNFEAILFDCDGVLVDSEAITCGVLRDMFEAQGWRMTLAECMQRFVGHTVKSQRSVIEAHTGQPLTEAWLEQFFARRNESLTQSITAIEGVHEAVYLAAAAHLQIDPARCLVVEDTTVGITAGVAAGATVWAYAAPPAEHAPLLQAGAQRVFMGMHELRLS